MFNNSIQVCATICRIILLAELFSLGCIKDKSDLEKICSKISKDVDFNTRELYRKSNIDSTGRATELIYADVEKALCSLPETSQTNIYLNSKVGDILDSKILFVSLSLHQYLNKGEIDLRILKDQFRDIGNFQWSQFHKMMRGKKFAIAIKNYKCLEFGDTVKVDLMFDAKYGRKIIYYSGNPAGQPSIPAENSLNIIGVLLEKYPHDLLADTIEPTDVIFKLRILQLSQKDVCNPWNVIEVGDTFDLDLIDYGKLIQKYTWEP